MGDDMFGRYANSDCLTVPMMILQGFGAASLPLGVLYGQNVLYEWIIRERYDQSSTRRMRNE